MLHMAAPLSDRNITKEDTAQETAWHIHEVTSAGLCEGQSFPPRRLKRVDLPCLYEYLLLTSHTEA